MTSETQSPPVSEPKAELVDALEDALSVCRSVDRSKGRTVEHGGCTMHLQTAEWCAWLETEVGPKVEKALALVKNQAPDPAQINEDDVRTAFESEMRCEDEWGHKNLKRDKRGDYLNSWTGSMWAVWKACAATYAEQVARAERNRDMWREQCRGQAAQLEAMRAIPAPEGAQELPPLPATDYRLFYEDEGDEDHGDEGYQEVLDEPGYTAKEMRDYALAAISARTLAYQQANPLGGPAKVFRAMADAIEAGDSYEDTLRRYGFAEAAPAPQAPVALTDEQIAMMRQAGYLDADDYPEPWAYERGFRDAERAHGITQTKEPTNDR